MGLDNDSLSDLLAETEVIYKHFLDQQISLLDSWSDSICHQQNNLPSINYSELNSFHKKNNLEELENIFLGFKTIRQKEELLSRKKSIRFNVLNFFHIDETLHSKLLGFFLNDRASHGQGDLFLKKFIEMLEYTDYERGKWKVTIEKQKIDILIERKHPFSAVIIENKSNGAYDQENQIYRYWHKVIYNKSREHINEDSKFKIIYLVSDDGKLPSENTLVRPVNFSEDLPGKVPIDVDIWNFNNQIQDWLEECLSVIPDENYRLKEYIQQYIEYWN